MEQIIVKNLTKTFQIKLKKNNAKGLFATFASEKRDMTVVDNISFSINRGETVAFIGPNGAGKSTTIKMLTGILYPSFGTASIKGIDPWKERQKLAFIIGTVFGQKSQLSFHLPAEDSFRLFARIYELDDAVYKERLNKLIEIFSINEYIKQPLRKLSLGQRMRCEIVASLLHDPEVIFLDEPTIGLDVIAKRDLRDVLRNLNKELNTTIFLTSHDTGDIEALCKRTIIINKGKLIFDDGTAKLKQEHIMVKRLYIRFEEKVDDFKMEHVKVLSKSKYGVSLEVDITKRNIREILQDIIKNYSIVDINVDDPSLEEIISNIYEQK